MTSSASRALIVPLIMLIMGASFIKILITSIVLVIIIVLYVNIKAEVGYRQKYKKYMS